jgi:hypothetical protein
MNDNDRLQDEIDELERSISKDIPQDNIEFVLQLSLKLRHLVTLVREHERKMVMQRFPDMIGEIMDQERNATFDEDIMLHQAGSIASFCCPNEDVSPGRKCGCNVFRRLKRDFKRFKCNACGAIYIKDPDPT